MVMPPNWKSATFWGVMLWVLIFVEISITMFAPVFKDNARVQTMVNLVILPVLVLTCSYMYFKGTKPTMQNGIVLGLYFLIVGIILHLAVTIPLFVKSYDFFGKTEVLFGFIETIVFSTLAGYFLGKHEQESS